MDQTFPIINHEFYHADKLARSNPREEAGYPVERRAEPNTPAGFSEESELGALRIAWIDCYALTRDCILRAILELQPTLKVSPFVSVTEFVHAGDGAFDLIIFYSHASYDVCLQEIAAIRQALEAAPLIMLSDLEDSHQLNTIRGALRAGANGFISTRSTGLAMTLSAIRFVQAGGFCRMRVRLLRSNRRQSPPIGLPPVRRRFSPSFSRARRTRSSHMSLA
jgi:DNA-binding NarL/FixJ family response regulator